jgi:hypothetical protein
MSKAMLYFLCLKSAFKIRNALNKNVLKCYNIDDFDLLKKQLDMIKTLILTLNNNIELNINMIDTISHKENKIKIINTFYDKFIKTYEICCVYNYPEIGLYNKIIDISKYTEEILFVSIQFPLPISFKRVLFADIFITLCINNIYHFCIVEYDGPTHYNIHDYRFDINQVHRDITKNNFCKKNNISIIRIFDHDENPEGLISVFINSVISNNGEPIFNIPEDKHYENILTSYEHYSLNLLLNYIKSNNKVNKYHTIPVNFAISNYNKKNYCNYIIDNQFYITNIL